MPRRAGLIFMTLTLACSSGEQVLALPEAGFEFETGLLFVEADQGASLIVEEAHVISFDTPPLLRVEHVDPVVLRLLLFSETAEDLHLSLGPLTRPANGVGRPIPRAAASFWAGTELGLEWEELDPVEASRVAFELPALPPRNRCEEFRFPSFSIPELNEVQPATMVALGPDRVIVGGYRTEGDLSTSAGSMLVVIEDFENGPPVITPIGESTPRDWVSSLVESEPGRLLGATASGQIFRVDVATSSRTDAPVRLASGRVWRIAHGVGDLYVIYDGTHPSTLTPAPTTRPAWVLDPNTLEIRPFEAPEPPSELVILDRNFMIAASTGRVHVFEDGAWRPEMEVQDGLWITDLALDPVSRRSMAVIASTFVMERSSAGAWSALPSVRGSFGINEGVFLSSGDYVVGGGAGFYSLWDGSEWCQPEARPFSRDLRAMAKVPGTDMVLTVTYSERLSEPMLLARMEFSLAGD